MALSSTGHIRYQLKTAYPDGTMQIVFEVLDLNGDTWVCSVRLGGGGGVT